jgi:hypothetical protein
MQPKEDTSAFKKYLVRASILTGIVIVLLVIFGFNNERESTTIDNVGSGEIYFNFDNAEVKIDEDGTKYIVDPDKIRSGGPPKGGIGIDIGISALAKSNIKFVSVTEANNWITDNELVLAIEHKGIKRVYPLQILVWHEIANDEIEGDPILITYCPLCGSGIAYERSVEVDGEKIETRFGTSGKLYNSNLIMYDELTDTYWQQIDGKAIVGELVPQELTELSIDTVVWRDYKDVHPDAEVLSQDTGYNRAYGVDPYGNYYEDSYLIFPVDNEDDSVHPKTVIFGIEVNGVFKAYRENDLKENPEIEDTVNGIKIKIERDNSGIVTITNIETGEEIIKERDFWFAWYAFHPETELFNR